MTLTAPEIDKYLPITLTAPGMTEEEFHELLVKFPDATVEYSADGTVTLMPPTSPKSGKRVHEVGKQLGIWADKQGKGDVCGPDTGFRFPDGSRFAPDAAWFDSARWAEAEKSGESFPIFAPEFVIEVRSPDDRIRLLREKMEAYISNGVQLAWLIDPKERSVTVYRPGHPPQVLNNPASMAGEGPVEGFVLDLARVLCD
ncbi:MAG TPA: Uma2 family endonuclease [Bryobacteraceae bacterium]|nr:Uma2 family endonuclease [Bryobacteraceae bacterium]